MASPAKKRKLNTGSKSTAIPSRNLDYFFGKKNQELPPTPKVGPAASSEDNESATVLTDEQLARKLQAEWDRETAGAKGVVPGESVEENDNDTVSPKIGADEVVERTTDPKHVANSNVDSAGGTNTAEIIDQPTAADLKSKNTLSLQAAGSAEDTISSNIPFDQSPLTFEPSKYVQELQGHWAADSGNASYALLTRCFVLVNSTQSRIKIVDTLVNMLRVIIEADPSSLLPTVWLATNSISPPYISLELGLGGSAISKALKNVCGLDSKSLKALYDKHGDAGDVAFEAKKKQSFTLRKPKPLSIKGVYQSLVKIASTQGTGSGEVKQRIVDRLLQDARGAEESRYVVRTLCQHVSNCYITFLSDAMLTHLLASNWCREDYNADCSVTSFPPLQTSRSRLSLAIATAAPDDEEGSASRGVGQTRRNSQSMFCEETQL
jgi:DNA ligase-1